MRAALPIVFLTACGFSAGGGMGVVGDDDQPTIDAAIDSPGVTQPWLTGWAYRKKITIHASKIATAVTDFPVAVVLADPDIAAHSLASRADIAFTAVDATTRLSHELEAASADGFTAWVKVPALSPAADTEIYVYYGNPNPSAINTTSSAVWSDSFSAVYHFQRPPSGAADQPDATSHNRNGTSMNLAAADSQASPLGRALDFNGTSSVVSVAAFDLGNTFTIAAWFNMNDVSQIRTLFSNSPDRSDTNGIRFFVNSNGTSDREISVETGNGNNSGTASTHNNSVVAGQWSHVVAIVDRTNGAADIIVNGESDADDKTTRDDYATNQAIEIGRMQTNNPFDGLIDDMQISSVARSADWVRTAYTNQHAPAEFYAVGAEESL